MRSKLEKAHEDLAKNWSTFDLSYCDPAAKQKFHNECRKYLRLLAAELKCAPSGYDLRSNKAGIACSGEITLHTDRLYVQISQSSMMQGVCFLVRGCAGRKDYRGLHNNLYGLQSDTLGDLLWLCETSTRKTQ